MNLNGTKITVSKVAAAVGVIALPISAWVAVNVQVAELKAKQESAHEERKLMVNEIKSGDDTLQREFDIERTNATEWRQQTREQLNRIDSKLDVIATSVVPKRVDATP